MLEAEAGGLEEADLAAVAVSEEEVVEVDFLGAAAIAAAAAQEEAGKEETTVKG